MPPGGGFNLTMSKKKNSYREKVEARGDQRKAPFSPKTLSQKELIISIKNNPITIGTGAAGCGKTITALFCALYFLEEQWVDNIYYLRCQPKSDNHRDPGAFKGTHDEKFSVLLTPLELNLRKLVPPQDVDCKLKRIKGMFLDEIRGVDFSRAFVIADEMQNADPESVKTLLTRINMDSRLVILGDSDQRDTHRFVDGLEDATNRLKNINGIGITEFGEEDIVRNPLIKDILKAYRTEIPRDRSICF